MDIGLPSSLCDKVMVLLDLLTNYNVKEYLIDSFDKDYYILATVIVFVKLVYGLHDKNYGIFMNSE